LYFVENSELSLHTTTLELHAALIAAFSHDVGHPGVTNRFLIATTDRLAYRYNDKSVLENMHSSIVFKTMLEPENDLLIGHEGEEWMEARRIIVEMILDTDMARHFDI
jgi:hypothetical protein